MKRLKDIVFALAHPKYWYRAYPANKHVDHVLNKALDQYTIRDASPYKPNTVTIGPYSVEVITIDNSQQVQISVKTLGLITGVRYDDQFQHFYNKYFNKQQHMYLPYRRTANRLLTRIVNDLPQYRRDDQYEQFINNLYRPLNDD